MTNFRTEKFLIKFAKNGFPQIEQLHDAVKEKLERICKKNNIFSPLKQSSLTQHIK
jgi:hypothetical protein